MKRLFNLDAKKVFSMTLAFAILITPVIIVLSGYYSIEWDYQKYILDIGSSNDTDATQTFYFRDLKNQYRNSDSISNDDRTYREITGGPVYLYFSPAKPIKENSNVKLELTLKSDSDIDFGFLDKDGKIEWDYFYIKTLDDYNYITSFEDISIYSNGEDEDKRAKSLQDWIKKNLTLNSRVKFLDDSIDLSKLEKPCPEDFESEETTNIDNLFGPHEFYIYASEEINLQIFAKTSIQADSAPNVEINIYRPNGTRLSHNDYEIASGSKENEMLDITVPIGKHGVYRIVLDTEENIYFPTIKINSNKVIIKDNITFSTNTEVYMHSRGNPTWDKMFADEAIQVYNEQGDQVIIKSDELTLEEGFYKISLPKGKRIEGDYFFINKENFFEPYIFRKTNINPSFVIGRYYREIGDGWVRVIRELKGEMVLDKLNDNQLIIALDSTKLQTKYGIEKHLVQEYAFKQNINFSNVALYSEKELINEEGDSLEEIIIKNFQENALLYVNNYPLSYEAFLKDFSHLEELENKQINYGFIFRGAVSIYALTKGNLNLHFIKEDLNRQIGTDKARLKIENLTQRKTSIYTLKDDGIQDASKGTSPQTFNIHIPADEVNLFRITFDADQEVTFKDIQFLGMKSVLWGNYTILNSGSLYLNPTFPTEITLRYPNLTSDKSILLERAETQQITFSKEEGTEKQSITFDPGDNLIHFEENFQIISETYFAQNANLYFQPLTYLITEDYSQCDIAVIGRANNQIFFDQAIIEILTPIKSTE